MASDRPPPVPWGTSILVVLAAALASLLGLAVASAVANAGWTSPGERPPERRGAFLVGVVAVATFGVSLAVRALRSRARVFLPVGVVLLTAVLTFGTVTVLVLALWDDAGRAVPLALGGVLLAGLVLAVVLVRHNPRPEGRERFLTWVVPISLLAAGATLTPWAGMGRSLMPSAERHALAVARFGPSYLGAYRTVRGCPAVLGRAAPSSVAVSPFRGRAQVRRDGESGTYHFRLGGGLLRGARVALVARPEPGGGFRFVGLNGDPSVSVEVRTWPRAAPTRVRCPVASGTGAAP